MQAVVVGLLALAVPSTSSAAGATMGSDPEARARALVCSGDPRTGPTPVLLVPGTGMSASENWSMTYRPPLLAEGRAVCTISLPRYAVGDLQVSIEYVASGIRRLHLDAGRRIAVMGHSQGAQLPRVALRVWPDLAGRVEDVIGLAGAYDRGSAGLTQRCARSCVPALHQLAHGSLLLASMSRRALPAGPAYTNIGTNGDRTVTPQPDANTQRGATAVQIQDVCPGRTIETNEHGLIIGDAVAKALVDDALANPGPAVASRVPVATCDQVYYEGFDRDRFLESISAVSARLRPTTTSEPSLRCHLRTACGDVIARGRLLEKKVRTITATSITWQGDVQLDGRLRIRFGSHTIDQRVAPGPYRLRINRPRGSGVFVLETRPDRYSVWAREDAVRLP